MTGFSVLKLVSGSRGPIGHRFGPFGTPEEAGDYLPKKKGWIREGDGTLYCLLAASPDAPIGFLRVVVEELLSGTKVQMDPPELLPDYPIYPPRKP